MPALIMHGLAVLLVILLPTLLLIEEYGPAVVPDRGGDAGETEERMFVMDELFHVFLLDFCFTVSYSMIRETGLFS